MENWYADIRGETVQESNTSGLLRGMGEVKRQRRRLVRSHGQKMATNVQHLRSPMHVKDLEEVLKELMLLSAVDWEDGPTTTLKMTDIIGRVRIALDLAHLSPCGMLKILGPSTMFTLKRSQNLREPRICYVNRSRAKQDFITDAESLINAGALYEDVKSPLELTAVWTTFGVEEPLTLMDERVNVHGYVVEHEAHCAEDLHAYPVYVTECGSDVESEFVEWFDPALYQEMPPIVDAIENGAVPMEEAAIPMEEINVPMEEALVPMEEVVATEERAFQTKGVKGNPVGRDFPAQAQSSGQMAVSRAEPKSKGEGAFARTYGVLHNPNAQKGKGSGEDAYAWTKGQRFSGEQDNQGSYQTKGAHGKQPVSPNTAGTAVKGGKGVGNLAAAGRIVQPLEYEQESNMDGKQVVKVNNPQGLIDMQYDGQQGTKNKYVMVMQGTDETRCEAMWLESSQQKLWTRVRHERKNRYLISRFPNLNANHRITDEQYINLWLVQLRYENALYMMMERQQRLYAKHMMDCWDKVMQRICAVNFHRKLWCEFNVFKSDRWTGECLASFEKLVHQALDTPSALECVALENVLRQQAVLIPAKAVKWFGNYNLFVRDHETLPVKSKFQGSLTIMLEPKEYGSGIKCELIDVRIAKIKMNGERVYYNWREDELSRNTQVTRCHEENPTWKTWRQPPMRSGKSGKHVAGEGIQYNKVSDLFLVQSMVEREVLFNNPFKNTWKKRVEGQDPVDLEDLEQDLKIIMESGKIGNVWTTNDVYKKIGDPRGDPGAVRVLEDSGSSNETDAQKLARWWNGSHSRAVLYEGTRSSGEQWTASSWQQDDWENNDWSDGWGL